MAVASAPDCGDPDPPRSASEHILEELKAAAEEGCDLEGHGAAHVALQAATMLMKGDDGARDIPKALLALLEVAGVT